MLLDHDRLLGTQRIARLGQLSGFPVVQMQLR